MRAAIMLVSAALAMGPAEGTAQSAAPGARAAAAVPAGGGLLVNNCLVELIQDPVVAAQEAGVLKEIKVEEGDQVNEGDVIAQVDDRLAAADEKVALYSLKAAEQEAGNNINVRFAQMSEKVAQAEYEQAIESNKRHQNTVPAAELRRFWLQSQQATLGIEQATHELGLAQVKVDVRKAELEKAQTSLEHRKVVSPITGMVVQKHHEPGEWLQLGEPIVRVVRLDRLWVKGSLDAAQVAPHQVVGKPVTVRVTLAGGHQEAFEGVIKFASPEIQGDGTFQVKAEVVNRKAGENWLLLPGYFSEMLLQVQ